jgi:glutaredoxin
MANKKQPARKQPARKSAISKPRKPTTVKKASRKTPAALKAKRGIVIYSMIGCHWCELAMAALRAKNKKFTNVAYDPNGSALPRMMPNKKRPESFPQIWVNGVNKGGYSEMSSWM